MINILFFGTPQFSVPTLEALCTAPNISVKAVITQPDRPIGRGGIVTPPPIKVCAQSYGIPVVQPTSLKKEFANIRSNLEALGPFDVGVVIAFGQILPPEVLAFPKAGCINIHASLLPRWRGAAPIQRAIESGDDETGVCLMQMDAGLDTGNVFSRLQIPLLQTDTYESVHNKLSRIGATLLLRDIHLIVKGELPATPQPSEGVTYARKITAPEMRIDWARAATDIHRKIRALSPSPGCHCLLDGKRLKILKAQPAETPPHTSSSPGTILQALSDTLTIKCGVGSLRLEEVQLEGKRRMLIDEFLRGSQLTSGTQLL